MRWANDNCKQYSVPVLLIDRPDRNSLIAEVAFRLAKSSFSPGAIPPASVEGGARELISRLPRGQSSLDRLEAAEWAAAVRLCRSIQLYVSPMEQAQYSPKAPGCGAVGAAEADILRSDELIEVKAVYRPFRGSDFRQVLTYAAMMYTSGTTIEKVTLLNPRLGIFVAVSLDHVAAGSCGRSRVELMQDLIGAMTEIQVSA